MFIENIIQDRRLNLKNIFESCIDIIDTKSYPSFIYININKNDRRSFLFHIFFLTLRSILTKEKRSEFLNETKYFLDRILYIVIDPSFSHFLPHEKYKTFLTQFNANFMNICSKYITIEITFTSVKTNNILNTPKQTAIAEFDKRLDAYSNNSPIPIQILNELKIILILNGEPNPDEIFKQRPLTSGRKHNTDIGILSSAITKLQRESDKKFCYSHIENVAKSIWGYKYYNLTPDDINALRNDYIKTQILFDEKRKNNDNIKKRKADPNINIRMLWHFDRLRIPYDAKMFKIPETTESRLSNMNLLKIIDNRNLIL